MDVSKMPFQTVVAVNRVRAGSVEHQVNSPDRLVHTMDNRQPCLRNRLGRIRRMVLQRRPRRANGRQHVGACGIDDGLASAARACTSGRSRNRAVDMDELLRLAISVSVSMAPRAMPRALATVELHIDV